MFNRSYHFIPADKPHLFERLEQIGADCYVFDLEDAVSSEAKDGAVRALQDWLAQQAPDASWFLRVNGYEAALAGQEQGLLAAFPWLSVVLPKLTSAAALERSFAYYGLSGRRVIGLVEDARALTALDELLQPELLSALGLGLEDFLCGSVYETSQLDSMVQTIRSRIALAAMSHGIEAIDTVSLDFSKEGEQLRREGEHALAAGMTAKFSIHPNQVGIIHECFMPPPEMLKRAGEHRDWLTDAALDAGYFKQRGEVFSPPKVKKLKRVLKYMEHHGFE